jgi:hypothetical protein
MDLSQQAFAMEWDLPHDASETVTVWDAPVEVRKDRVRMKGGCVAGEVASCSPQQIYFDICSRLLFSAYVLDI